jgi:hypothetical protein
MPESSRGSRLAWPIALPILDTLAPRLGLPGEPPPPGSPAREAMVQRLLGAGSKLTALAVLVQTVVHLVNLAAFDLDYQALDADKDSSVFAFASSAATLGCAAAVLMLAPLWQRGRLALAALAAVLAFLSLDDMFRLHDRVGIALDFEFMGLEQMGRLVWPAVWLPLLASAFAGLWAVSSAMRPEPRNLLRTGLAALVVAVALEMAGLVVVNVGFDAPSLPYEVQVVLEEGAELAGWLLIWIGLAAGALGSASAAPAGPHATERLL